MNDQLVEALRPVQDPELHRSIVDLGMLRQAELDGDGTAQILVALTIAGCPLRNEITNRVTSAVEPLDGVRSVDLEFTVMTDDEREALRKTLHGDAGRLGRVQSRRTATPRVVRSRSPSRARRRGRC